MPAEIFEDEDYEDYYEAADVDVCKRVRIADVLGGIPAIPSWEEIKRRIDTLASRITRKRMKADLLRPLYPEIIEEFVCHGRAEIACVTGRLIK